RVSADINFDSISHVEEKYDPEGQIPRNSIVTEEKMDTVTANPLGGVPGMAANSGETNSVASTPASSSKTNKKVTNTSYEINKTISNIMQTPGSVKRLSAAVFVAAQATGTGTNRVVTPRSPEEMQKIRRVVMGAVGIQEGPDASRPDQITIEEMPFNEEPAMEIAKQLDQQEKKQFWWEMAKTGIYPVLGLLVLFVFWRVFKSTPVEQIPLGVPVGSGLD